MVSGSFFKKISIVGLFLGLASCTPSTNWDETGNSAGRDSRKQNQNQTPKNTPYPNQPQAEQSEFGVELDEEQLVAVFAVNTEALSYKFTYMEVLKNGPIEFNEQKAKLVFSALPTGKTGNLTLEILEAGVPKLRGTQAGVTLQAGSNQVRLVLNGVNGGQIQPEPSPENPSVTYATVKPILDNKCVRCHSATGSAKGNVLFDTFPFTITNKTRFPDMPTLMRKVVQTVEMPNATMPQGNPGLPQSEVNQLKAWIAAGLK